MAQKLQNITIKAPSFKGLNTQDSPFDADPSYASVADNCVIDKYGRIGARKGFNTLTTDNSALSSEYVRNLKEYEKVDGTREIISVGNNKIFKGTTTLTDITGAHAITDDDWQLISFNNDMYFIQRGYEPLVYNGTSVVAISAHTGATGTAPVANCGTAAFGRLWLADTSTNKSTVYWSDLLIGASWSGGTSGSIDLSKVWPDGYDEITALTAHNGRLIIFGKRSIVIYSGAESPANMVLEDTITNVGCVQRDSVQSIGTDLLFLSHTGVQTLGRVIQERSLPINNVSRNVEDSVKDLINQETEYVKSVFSPENSFYLLYFPTANIVYVFDTKGFLENGGLRVTVWPDSPFKCFAVAEDSLLYVGGFSGIGTYSEYSDNNVAYPLRYYSNAITFGDTSITKFLKRIVPTIVGGQSSTVTIKWGYDLQGTYYSFPLSIGDKNVSEYNVGEYGVAEYSGTGETVLRTAVNTTGSGTIVTIGIEAFIGSLPLSIQEFNIQALFGRML